MGEQDDTVEIEVTISCMFSVTARFRTVLKIDRDEWEEMSKNQREIYMREETERILYEQVDVGWNPLNA